MELVNNSRNLGRQCNGLRNATKFVSNRCEGRQFFVGAKSAWS